MDFSPRSLKILGKGRVAENAKAFSAYEVLDYIQNFKLKTSLLVLSSHVIKSFKI